MCSLLPVLYAYLYARKCYCKKLKETNSQNTSEAELQFARLCTGSVVPQEFFFKKNITSLRVKVLHIVVVLSKFHQKKREKSDLNTSKKIEGLKSIC